MSPRRFTWILLLTAACGGEPGGTEESTPEAEVTARLTYPTGELRAEGASVDGLAQGEWSFYRRDGSLIKQGTFVDGRFDEARPNPCFVDAI